MRSTRFNESVAVDLTDWYAPVTERKQIICHMIDDFSKLSSGGIISSKNPEEFVHCSIEQWISKCGIPKRFFHDNGRDLVNDVLFKFLDDMEVKSIATPAFSPFCNGLVECHNAIVKTHMSKLRMENSMKQWQAETNLCYAMMAKNSMMNTVMLHFK